MLACVSVVIPTLEGQRWLPDCLAALGAQTFTDFEVILVDNRQGEASREVEDGQHGLRIRRIVNFENQGFATAANQGIRAGSGEYVALLNDDTKPAPGWLEALVRAARNEQAGAVASLMVYDDRPATVQSAGISIDRAAIAWDRLGGRPARDAREPAVVFGASGGAALYRRAMLDAIGLLDERFFAYLEDVDLAWRAQRAGWRCVFAPDALVRHVTSATAGEGSAYKKRLLGRNKVWLAAKNARTRDLPIVAAYDLAAVGYTLIVRRDPIPISARWEGLKRWVEFRRGRGGESRGLPFDPLVAPWRVPGRMAGR